MSSFDAQHGTETEAAASLDDLTIASPNASLGYPYQPTPEGVLTDAIAFLAIDASRYCFVDLGCGKGRTLITASKLGFDSIEGIEFAVELATIAQQNLANVGVANASVRCADAAEYEFPAKNLVIYVYNSFAEPVLEKVLQNLFASDVQNFYLIFRNPSHPHPLHDSAGLTYLGSPSGRGGVDGIHVWAKRSAEVESRSQARPPGVRSFKLFAELELEPYAPHWGDTEQARCSALHVRVSYRQAAPLVEHALVCAFDLGSEPEPELLRRAKLVQSKSFAAYDYLPKPKSELGGLCVSELSVRFDREVTLAGVALARWSNAGPITIVGCDVKLR